MSPAAFTVAWFGGAFVAPSEAMVSITHRGYLLGDGVFATIRGYHGVCFRAHRHLAMLARAAELSGLALPMDLADLADLADEAARRTGVSDAYVRVTLSRGDSVDAILSILARELDVPTPDELAHGVPVAVVAPRRVPPECLDPAMKTTSYAPSLLARREATARGVGEGLQLAVDGSVACATMANVFMVIGGALVTPHLASGCRPGVTREAILELARREGLDPREERISIDGLFQASEIFLTSTRVECLPVSSIDGKAIGRGAAEPSAGAARYPYTRALRAALRNAVTSETASRRRAR